MSVEELKMPTPEEIENFNKQRKQYADMVDKDVDSSLGNFVRKILSIEGSVSADDIMYSDAKHEDDLRKQGKNEELDIAEKSVLKVNETKISGEGLLLPGYSVHTMQGYISGKKVEVTDCDNVGTYSAAVDGQKVSTADAKKIFEKYFEAALERKKRIDALRSEDADRIRRENTENKVAGM